MRSNIDQLQKKIQLQKVSDESEHERLFDVGLRPEPVEWLNATLKPSHQANSNVRFSMIIHAAREYIDTEPYTMLSVVNIAAISKSEKVFISENGSKSEAFDSWYWDSPSFNPHIQIELIDEELETLDPILDSGYIETLQGLRIQAEESIPEFDQMRATAKTGWEFSSYTTL